MNWQRQSKLKQSPLLSSLSVLQFNLCHSIFSCPYSYTQQSTLQPGREGLWADWLWTALNISSWMHGFLIPHVLQVLFFILRGRWVKHGSNSYFPKYSFVTLGGLTTESFLQNVCKTKTVEWFKKHQQNKKNTNTKTNKKRTKKIKANTRVNWEWGQNAV